MEQPTKGCSGEFVWLILTVLQVLCRISLGFQSPVASLQSPQLRIQHRFRISHRQPPLLSSSLKINRKSIIPPPYIPNFLGEYPIMSQSDILSQIMTQKLRKAKAERMRNTKTKFYIPRALLLPALRTRLTRLTTIERKLWQEGLGRIFISPLRAARLTVRC